MPIGGSPEEKLSRETTSTEEAELEQPPEEDISEVKRVVDTLKRKQQEFEEIIQKSKEKGRREAWSLQDASLEEVKTRIREVYDRKEELQGELDKLKESIGMQQYEAGEAPAGLETDIELPDDLHNLTEQYGRLLRKSEPLHREASFLKGFVSEVKPILFDKRLETTDFESREELQDAYEKTEKEYNKTLEELYGKKEQSGFLSTPEEIDSLREKSDELRSRLDRLGRIRSSRIVVGSGIGGRINLDDTTDLKLLTSDLKSDFNSNPREVIGSQIVEYCSQNIQELLQRNKERSENIPPELISKLEDTYLEKIIDEKVDYLHENYSTWEIDNYDEFKQKLTQMVKSSIGELPDGYVDKETREKIAEESKEELFDLIYHHTSISKEYPGDEYEYSKPYRYLYNNLLKKRVYTHTKVRKSGKQDG